MNFQDVRNVFIVECPCSTYGTLSIGPEPHQFARVRQWGETVHDTLRRVTGATGTEINALNGPYLSCVGCASVARRPAATVTLFANKWCSASAALPTACESTSCTQCTDVDEAESIIGTWDYEPAEDW